MTAWRRLLRPGLPPEKWSSLKYGFWSREEDLRWAGNGIKFEEIVAKLRQVDVLTTQAQTVAEAIRWIGA